MRVTKDKHLMGNIPSSVVSVAPDSGRRTDTEPNQTYFGHSLGGVPLGDQNSVPSSKVGCCHKE